MNQDITPIQTIATAMGTIHITANDFDGVRDAADAAHKPNTRRAHESRLKPFTTWLESRELKLMDGVPVPVEIVAMYLRHRFDAGRKMNTIDADLAAISFWHTKQGMDSPSHHNGIRKTMAGLRQLTGEAIKQGAANRKPICADAATAEIIHKMIRYIDANVDCESLRLRDRALLLLGLASACRRSELASLCANNVQWHAGQGIILEIWNAKTGDRMPEIWQDDDPSLCAVNALRTWMDHANISHDSPEPVFRRIHITPKGFGIGGPIDGQVISRTMAKYAKAIGIAGRWSGHSLRAGFCVQSILDGRPESESRAQSGHKSAAMWDRYSQRTKPFSVRRNYSFSSR